MGDYTARKWKAEKREKVYVEFVSGENKVQVEKGLRFDKKGKLVR